MKTVKFIRTYIRSNGQRVVDLIRDHKTALCVCAHGKVWEEGDYYEESGGKACRECIEFGKIRRKKVWEINI